jgi:hypothetical protein
MKKKNLIVLFVLIAGGLLAGIIFATTNSKSAIESGEERLDRDQNEISATISNMDLDSLRLDQGEAFIAISNNDMEGFNRWIPFFFSFQAKSDIETKYIEEFMYETINYATLYNGKNIICTTDELVWSVGSSSDNSYTITLIVLPDLDELEIDGIVEIDTLSFSTNDKIVEYILPSYKIEARDTVPESDLYVSLSAIDAELEDDLIARIGYGIMQRNGKVENFELDYPANFANIEKYIITGIEEKEDGVVEYSVDLYFADLSTKVLYRPFIKVEYSGKTGWMIPTVPVYISLKV